MHNDKELDPVAKAFNQKRQEIETAIVDDILGEYATTQPSTSARTRTEVLTEILSDEEDRSWGYIVDQLEAVCWDGTNAFYDFFQTLLDMVADGTVKEWGGSFDRTYQLATDEQ